MEPNGEYVASAGAIWKAESGECIRLFTPSFTLSMGVAWSPTVGNLLGHTSRTTTRSTSGIGRPTRFGTCGAVRAHLWCLAFNPDGKRLASGSTDGTVKVWDLTAGAVLRTFQVGNNVSSVDWHPDGDLLAAGIGDGHGVYVWSVATGETVARREEDLNGHVFLSWRPDGRQLAVTTRRPLVSS